MFGTPAVAGCSQFALARRPFQRHGDPLAAADAQGDKAARQAVALH